jgi:outer membrane immunogenic protein
MKRSIVAGFGLLAAATAPVLAADIPMKAPVSAPVIAPAFSWSGCYIGGNAGWVGGRTNHNTAPGGNYLNAAGVLAPPNAAGTGLLTGDFVAAQHSYSSTNSGWEAGAQIGCNRQFGSFVLGAEADFNWSGLRTSVNAFYPPFASVSTGGFTISRANENISTRMDWFSTVRARGGFAFDRWLVFATGGLAIGHFRSNTSVIYGADGTSPVFANSQHIGSNERTRLGFAVGGGVEYAFDNNWSLKAEYLFMDFGTWTYSSPLVAPAGVAPGYLWVTSVRSREHIARIGINYRFGGIL